jgi:sulfite reductase alpha subunit-like flavoprotein
MTHDPLTSPAASTSSLESTATEGPDHVVILYASETGNTQDAAERVGREFRRNGRKAIVLSMDTFDIVRTHQENPKINPG